MRTYLSIVFLSISYLVVAGGCKSSKGSNTSRLPGMWQVQPIVVDGSNKDWPSPYPEYDEKAQLGYAVTNDKDNLYITVETGDQATQLKILRNGLTVWIDKSGGKDEVTAINYPIPANFGNKTPGAAGNRDERGEQSLRMQMQQGDVQKKRLAMTERIKKLMDDAGEFSLEGFKACNAQFPVLGKDSCGIMVHMGLDEDNELIWEAVIPLRSFWYKAQVEKRDMGKPVSICFETTGLPRTAGQGSGGGRSSGGGFRPSVGVGMGGGLGMSMGGHGGRGGGRGQAASGPDNSMEPMYKSTKTWKRFGLAYHEQ